MAFTAHPKISIRYGHKKDKLEFFHSLTKLELLTFRCHVAFLPRQLPRPKRAQKDGCLHLHAWSTFHSRTFHWLPFSTRQSATFTHGCDWFCAAPTILGPLAPAREEAPFDVETDYQNFQSEETEKLDPRWQSNCTLWQFSPAHVR